MRKTILADTELSVHLQNYKDSEYIQHVQEVFTNTDLLRTVSATNRGRIVATLLHNLDRKAFLSLPLDLIDVLNGCKILDARREAKSLIKKISKKEQALLDNQEHKKLSRQIKKLKTQKETAIKLYEGVMNLSLTLARIKIVKEWTRRIPAIQLTLKALVFDSAPWVKLADMCHFAPKDFQPDWFLSYCFTKKIPEESLLFQLSKKRDETLFELYQTEPIPYEYLRIGGIEERMKKMVATKENLRTVLWYIDEIGNHDIVANRLKNESVDLPYSKLVDIIMKLPESNLKTLLIGVAESKLENYRLQVESPVAIFCDASGSMEVAIRTSAIVASLLCAITHAELNVFRDKNEIVANPPRTVQQAVDFATSTKANYATSPASSMHRYITEKRLIKTIIIVTDQQENTTFDGKFFSGAYEKYATLMNHYPKIVFMTFGKTTLMIDALRNKQYDQLVTNYLFDREEPDLRKLDAILSK